MIAFVYLGVLVVAFFVLVVRPQRRQLAAHRALVASLEVGDEVITTSGMYGTIRMIDDDTLHIEIAPNVTVRFARQAVSRRVTLPADD